MSVVGDVNGVEVATVEEKPLVPRLATFGDVMERPRVVGMVLLVLVLVM